MLSHTWKYIAWKTLHECVSEEAALAQSLQDRPNLSVIPRRGEMTIAVGTTVELASSDTTIDRREQPPKLPAVKSDAGMSTRLRNDLREHIVRRSSLRGAVRGRWRGSERRSTRRCSRSGVITATAMMRAHRLERSLVGALGRRIRAASQRAWRRGASVAGVVQE